MNKKLLLFTLALALVLAMGAYENFYPTGAPAGYTGSPGDGQNCTSCHGGTATTTAGLITSNIPASGYQPGATYQITATNNISGSGKYGFEVSPQNSSGALMGTLSAGVGSQLVGGNKYVTHLSASLVTNSWVFNWTAPSAGSGSVTFYGAFAKGKPGPVTLSSLVVNEAVSAPAPAGPIAGPAIVCNSTVQNYSVGTISGATSYVWSVPAGAMVTTGQGTTSITVSYSSAASAGNVSVYGTNTGGNGAPSNLAITITSVPTTAATPSGPVSVDLLNTAQSNYSTTGSSGATSYVWEITPSNAGSIEGNGTTATVTWDSFAGNAEVRVMAVNDCGEAVWSAGFITEVYNSVGIDSRQSSTLLVYPSPGNGLIHVDLTGLDNTVSLTLSDLSGRVVEVRQVVGGNRLLQSFTLPSGIYVLVADNGLVQRRTKLIID